MRRMPVLLLLSVLAGPTLTPQDNQGRIEALREYLLQKDYPEVFGNTHYRIRVEDVLDVDIDNDGAKELVVQFVPHYRQSAPIVIYKIGPQLEVTRVTEGLAPGPLQKLSGDYLDSHALGMAVDFELGGKNRAEDVAGEMMKHLGGVVIYNGFYHGDDRKGPAYFIDMRRAQLPSTEHNCATFEFSKVRQIAAGGLREDPSRNYLAAWVGNEIYVYLLRGISSEGMLDKQFWVVKAPEGFDGFEPGKGLTYKTASGTAILTLLN